jgi:hypothetical protein
MERMHERVDRRYRIPRFKEMPSRIQLLVHNCPQYAWKPQPDHSTLPPYCKNCNKIVPWFVFKCVACDKHFIKDFRHPKFCSLFPTCWEHTLELKWDFCTDHMYHNDEIVEPHGLNPVEFVIDFENDPDFDFLKT